MEDNNPAANMSNDEIFDAFVEGLMAEKDIDAPTDEIHQKIHDEVKTQLLTEIDRSLIAELPDEKLNELNAAAEAGGGVLDPQIVAAAIEEAGLDAVEIAGVTMQRFRNLYLGRPVDAVDEDEPQATEPAAAEATQEAGE